MPPAALTEGFAKGVLPPEVGPVAVDLTLKFDRPWDWPALEGDNPVLEQVEVREIPLTWGKLDLRGRGTLDVDAQGFAEALEPPGEELGGHDRACGVGGGVGL